MFRLIFIIQFKNEVILAAILIFLLPGKLRTRVL